MSVRAGILFWSTVSGVVLGAFAGAMLFGAGLIAVAISAAVGGPRPGSRWTTAILIILFGALPLAGAVLGFMEGRLKLR